MSFMNQRAVFVNGFVQQVIERNLVLLHMRLLFRKGLVLELNEGGLVLAFKLSGESLKLLDANVVLRKFATATL